MSQFLRPRGIPNGFKRTNRPGGVLCFRRRTMGLLFVCLALAGPSLSSAGHGRDRRVCAVLLWRLRGGAFRRGMGGGVRRGADSGGIGTVRLSRHVHRRSERRGIDAGGHRHGDGGQIPRGAQPADAAAVKPPFARHQPGPRRVVRSRAVAGAFLSEDDSLPQARLKPPAESVPCLRRRRSRKRASDSLA